MVYLDTWFRKAVTRKRIYFMNSLKAKSHIQVSHLFHWDNSMKFRLTRYIRDKIQATYLKALIQSYLLCTTIV